MVMKLNPVTKMTFYHENSKYCRCTKKQHSFSMIHFLVRFSMWKTVALYFLCFVSSRICLFLSSFFSLIANRISMLTTIRLYWVFVFNAFVIGAMCVCVCVYALHFLHIYTKVFKCKELPVGGNSKCLPRSQKKTVDLDDDISKQSLATIYNDIVTKD